MGRISAMPVKLPLVLSPNLGCPQIISLLKHEHISIIVASEDEQFGAWSLVPSFSNQFNSLDHIPLIQGDILEIPRHSDPVMLSVNDTEVILSRDLLSEVLGNDLRIFKVTLSLAGYDPSRVLRKVKNNFRPTLYDLSLEGSATQSRPHAVCLTESKDKDLRFIHLTDLHLARRNDIIEEEISSACGPVNGFNNFNDRMRVFIEEANKIADKGELDLVLIGGDLVDFVNHGVSDNAIEDDNNWQVFVDIATGGGCEHKKGKNNYGLRVPIFTSTGNHDWRLHPYDPTDVTGAFGIDRSQANNFDSEYYDTVEMLEAKKRGVYEKIVKEGSPILKENLLHGGVKWLLGILETWQAKTLVPIISAIISYFFKEVVIWPMVIFLIAAVLHHIINYLLYKWLRYMIGHAVIPIEAGVQALHYYFLHINPYFNYAFSYGSNYFIVMDTGPDCFIGQYFWDGGNKKMARMTINDNILGGSPDSMAFYPANEYYSYGQITWLENLLKAIGSEGKDNKRIFICLHAPPINLKSVPEIPAGQDELLLREGEIDIRYGTINHFLSQFFHLCLGEKENDPDYSGPKVDIVFSGHAHQKIEFRIDKGPLIYIGKYSDNALNPILNFNNNRPFVVQTAACGPLNTGYPNPPYFRTVHVDKSGVIQSFRQNR